MPLGKSKGKTFSGAAYDPLLDVLISVVGFLMVVVLFAVMSSQGKMITQHLSLTIMAPMLRDSTEEIGREIFLVRQGRVSHFGFEHIINDLFEEIESSRNPSDFLRKLKGQFRNDGYFEYRIKTYASPKSIAKMEKNIPIITAEIRSLSQGESQSNLDKPASRIKAMLMEMGKTRRWVHFLVDSESVSVFHTAREFARMNGAIVGWEPLAMQFPLEECLLGCEGEGSDDLQIIRGFQSGFEE